MSIYFKGRGCFESFLQTLDAKETLVVAGQKSSQGGMIAKALKELSEENENISVFFVSTNLPRVEIVPDAKHFERIICIGGGKIMDIGKIISLNLSNAVIRKHLSKGEFALHRKTELVCIPTTCGSGSEATHFAVCYMQDKKYSIAHPSLLPDTVVLDPDFLMSQSVDQTKIGALDGLCQCIESMFSKTATADSISYSKAGIALAATTLQSVVEKGLNDHDYEAFQDVANISGCAINFTKTNLPHALSYYLTLKHNISHGLAVALFYEAYLQTLQTNSKHLTELQRMNLGFVCQNLCGSEHYVPGTFTRLLTGLSLPSRLSEIEPAVDRAELLQSVNVERLKNFALAPDVETFLTVAFGAA